MLSPVEELSSRKEGGSGTCGWSLNFPMEGRSLLYIFSLGCQGAWGGHTPSIMFFGHLVRWMGTTPAFDSRYVSSLQTWVGSACLRHWAQALHPCKAWVVSQWHISVCPRKYIWSWGTQYHRASLPTRALCCFLLEVLNQWRQIRSIELKAIPIISGLLRDTISTWHASGEFPFVEVHLFQGLGCVHGGI